MALTPEEIERYKRHLVLREIGGQGQEPPQSRARARRRRGRARQPRPPLSGGRRASARWASSMTTPSRSATCSARSPMTTGARPPESRKRGRHHPPHQPVTSPSRRYNQRLDAEQRRGDHFRLRSRRRRLGQLRHALPRLGRLLLRQGRRSCSAPRVPFDGYVTTLKPHETAPDGTPYPSYRCIFPTRRRRGRWRTAPRSACSAPSSASSARCRRRKC